MRNLSSIQNKYTIPIDINIDIIASDQSTTYTFSLDHIVSIGNISWEGKMGGGMSVPSTYNVTLSTSLDFIKDNKDKLNRANVDIKVVAGTDAFYPHKGRVRGISRNTNDPNLMTLTIYDRFLDSNPKFPVASIVDSYTNAHPDTFNQDLGYPYYYGSHLRPFYFYAVDCNLSSMIGPFNVSSENHVNSVFYMTDKIESRDVSNQNNLLMNGLWSQEASGNTFDLNEPFEVQGLGPNDNRLFTLGAKMMVGKEIDEIVKGFSNETDQVSTGYYSGNDGVFFGGLETSRDSGSGDKSYVIGTEILPRFDKTILESTFLRLTATHSVTNVGSAFVNYRIVVASGDNHGAVLQVGSSIGPAPYSWTFASCTDLSNGSNNMPKFLTKNYKNYVFVGYDKNFTRQSSIQPTLTFSLDSKASFFSSKFSNYSVYATPVNTSDIAVSQNPFGILKDVFDQSSVSYVSAQNSTAQSNVTSYQLNCLFDVRQQVGTIAEEFGKITKTNMWVADSGMINFRTYQDSANATIDHTITTSDMIDFTVLESPLGSTIYQSTKYKRVTVDYEFDYSKQKYESSLQANPTNNSFCNSVDAIGIDNELNLRTNYIMSTDTASYYLGNAVAFNTQENEYVEVTLPARYYELELFDVVRVEHPMIVGSESTYQIIALSHNYQAGTVFIRGQELLRLS